MPYFAPYLDETGLHLPSYEDRLQELLSSYRSVFGQDADLTEANPDYQLLSLFAKSLDDLSAVLADVFASRNPEYATGAALDLLAPVYGLSRTAGENDASLRNRLLLAASASSRGSIESMDAAIRQLEWVTDCSLRVNDTAEASAEGIPPHTVAAVVLGGYADPVAQAIFDKKPPGIGTWGSASGTATDAFGQTHTVYFSRASSKPVGIEIYVHPLSSGFDAADFTARVRAAVGAYGETLRIGQELVVPALYGVCYGTASGENPAFAIRRIEATAAQTSSTELVTAAWNERLRILPGSVTVTVV